MRKAITAQIRRFANTCRWSLQGWRAAWATEKSLRQWTAANVVSVLLAFGLDLSSAQRGSCWPWGCWCLQPN